MRIGLNDEVLQSNDQIGRWRVLVIARLVVLCGNAMPARRPG
jgi:hypothetical protein